MSTELALWQPKQPVRVPANADTPAKILPFADSHQITARDKAQIISAFQNEHYEMVSSFVWTKALASLKAQLGKLGTAFIAEMLDRADIDGSLSIDQVLTDFEALRLAKELGVITGTGALRLRQSLERLMHFGQLGNEEGEEAQMTSDEAVGVIRACVENILGQERIDAALDFKAFRDDIENRLFAQEDDDIQTLVASPYFFQRASVRILLALIKSRQGAQLENTLANANLIFPVLWKNLLGPERFQIGRAYAEVTDEGKSSAASGLKKVLLRVRGFDYVPEDLRSKSFVKAANALLAAHEGMNNFYNEPGPAKHLDSMGSVIPTPAFPICMTAVLSVRLGNRWNVCYAAQKYANSILKRVSHDRWLYYLNDCLRTDDRILSKLLQDNPRSRWIEMAGEFNLHRTEDEIHDSNIRKLVRNTSHNRSDKIYSAVSKLIERLGY